MGNRMGVKVLFAVLLVMAAIGAGMYGYNVGVAQGIAQGAAAASAQPGAAPTAPVMFYPRPWGFGFGFFPFAPLFFLVFWVLIFRGLFWRGSRWGRGYGYGCGYGGVPPAFDEWHRRAHGQATADKTAPPQNV